LSADLLQREIARARCGIVWNKKEEGLSDRADSKVTSGPKNVCLCVCVFEAPDSDSVIGNGRERERERGKEEGVIGRKRRFHSHPAARR